MQQDPLNMRLHLPDKSSLCVESGDPLLGTSDAIIFKEGQYLSDFTSIRKRILWKSLETMTARVHWIRSGR